VTTRRTASIAVAAIALGVVASGCDIHFGVQDFRKQMAANAQVSAHVTAVNVSSSSGTVKIHAGTGSGVTIQRTVHYNSGHPHPSQSVQGGTLTFDNGCDQCTIDYDLTVPASVSVTAHADSGDVNVDGVASADLKTSSGTLRADNIKGSLSAHVDSGDIKLETVGGAVDVSTDSGSINGTGLSGTVANAKADSGDIRLDFTAIPTSVTARTSSGGLHVMVPDHPYDITGNSSSGGRHINVTQDPHSTNKLDLTTDSGDLTVDPA
jgi:Putative adhesin